MTATTEQFHRALQLHQSGRLPEAREAYERVLQHLPDHANALHYLGVLMCQISRPDAGAELINRAIAINPGVALYHTNLGTALKNCGKPSEAAAEYRKSIGISPDDPLTYSNLGDVLRDNGQLKEAVAACRRAIELKPDYANAYNNLGNALKDQDHLDEAVAAYRQAVRLDPNIAVIHSNLGSALIALGSIREAATACGLATKLDPNLADAFLNLGMALDKLNQPDDAIAAFRRAMELKPDSKEAHNQLGLTLSNRGLIDEAFEIRRRAAELQPDSAMAHNWLGNSWMDRGDVSQAVARYRTALALSPDLALARHNLLLAMNYDPSIPPDELLAESRKWNELFAAPLRQFILPHENLKDIDRCLRIGYVSPDFHDHPVARFILPALANRNRASFQIFCYSQSGSSDDMTEKLKASADAWRDISGMSDDQAAQLIRDDSIDILVDLAGHTPKNRLLLFARKPAPVQATYLGYPATTGLETIDYRITDAIADPSGLTDQFCSEQLVRLPQTAWCFSKPEHAPQVTEARFEMSRAIIFGSFNSFFKVNEPLLTLWAKILRAVPHSRLMLKAKGLEHRSLRQKVSDFMLANRVDSDRLDLRGRVSQAEHLSTYAEIDIALDTYPYHGTTTTCEAMYMGVPVITLAGQSHVSRVGVSLLSNAGLGDFIARSPEEYVDIAVNLASDHARLRELRQSLRSSMSESALMNESQFAADLESAYRGMWRRYCEGDE